MYKFIGERLRFLLVRFFSLP